MAARVGRARKRNEAFDGLRSGHYGTIVVDPPWRFRSNSAAAPGRNALRHYPCMSPAAIAALPVADLAGRDCRLYLWITAPFLAAGAHLPVLAAWGFSVSTLGFVWVKTAANGEPSTGLGHVTRQNPEFVVIGRRGRPARASRGVHSVIVAPRREHSRKPDEFYSRVEALSGDVPRAELFARERRPGWDAWGDEVGKFDGWRHERHE